MRIRSLGSIAILLSIGLVASVRAQSDDAIQSLKDSMSQDQQGSVLQGILGKGNGTGKKTDDKLQTPETVQKSRQNSDLYERANKEKTRDDRILRQFNEDPELRADDTVLIDVTPLEDICTRYGNGLNPLPNGPNNPNGGAGITGGSPGSSNASSLNALNAAAGLPGVSPIAGAGGANAANAINSTNVNNPLNVYDLTRCPVTKETDIPKTDQEKADSEKFRKRILSSNPYKLNRFGVLELPGLPAIPLAGLTAFEATKRLGADPDLSDYFVRVTLLRLLPTGQEALKPFGYDLFEGVPSTFAPVSDIQVPIDYIVGPGDTLEIQTFGNESSSYELTVERDGRINFPKLGPILVSGMSFDAAREVIEQRVAKQLIGTRVSVTMGDLRSIRVFVLGEAKKPGSYTSADYQP